jgi:Zn-dependent protease with chaperone function
MGRLCLVISMTASLLLAQSTEREVAMGKAMMQRFGQAHATVETPAAIAGLVQSLAPDAGVQIKVVESRDPMANTFPGRIVYVSTGLLDVATWAELTAILAHQIGHAMAFRVEKPDTSSATIPMIFMGSAEGLCARTVTMSARMMFPIGFQNRLALRETESDALAKQYLEQSNHSEVEWKSLFERPRMISPTLDRTPTLHR